MCGGRLEILPCSHVGHIFRGTNAHSRGLKQGTNVGEEAEKNKFRTAKVWLDDNEFEIFKSYDKWAGKNLEKYEMKGEMKNIENRQQFKQQLGCKNSNWYFDHVFPEIWKPNLKQIDNRIDYGLLTSSNSSDTYCIQAQILHNAVTIVNQCNKGQYAAEWFYDSERKEIRLYPDISGAPSFYGSCATSYNFKNSVIRIETCEAATLEPDKKKTWNVRKMPGNRFIVQSIEKENLCWTIDENDKLVKLAICEALTTDEYRIASKNMTRMLVLKRQLFYFN